MLVSVSNNGHYLYMQGLGCWSASATMCTTCTTPSGRMPAPQQPSPATSHPPSSSKPASAQMESTSCLGPQTAMHTSGRCTPRCTTWASHTAQAVYFGLTVNTSGTGTDCNNHPTGRCTLRCVFWASYSEEPVLSCALCPCCEHSWY